MAAKRDRGDLGAKLAAVQEQLARLGARIAESNRRIAASGATMARSRGLIGETRRMAEGVGLMPTHPSGEGRDKHERAEADRERAEAGELREAREEMRRVAEEVRAHAERLRAEAEAVRAATQEQREILEEMRETDGAIWVRLGDGGQPPAPCRVAPFQTETLPDGDGPRR